MQAGWTISRDDAASTKVLLVDRLDRIPTSLRPSLVLLLPDMPAGGAPASAFANASLPSFDDAFLLPPEEAPTPPPPPQSAAAVACARPAARATCAASAACAAAPMVARSSSVARSDARCRRSTISRRAATKWRRRRRCWRRATRCGAASAIASGLRATRSSRSSTLGVNFLWLRGAPDVPSGGAAYCRTSTLRTALRASGLWEITRITRTSCGRPWPRPTCSSGACRSTTTPSGEAAARCRRSTCSTLQRARETTLSISRTRWDVCQRSSLSSATGGTGSARAGAANLPMAAAQFSGGAAGRGRSARSASRRRRHRSR